MLIDTIKSDLVAATRRQDPEELKTIRFILSEINYAQIDKQKDLTDDDVVSVLQKEVKKRKEAIEMMRQAGRKELVAEEENKLTFINKYLPAQISSGELEKIVDETLATMPNPQMGAVIGKVMQKVKGNADGKTVSEIVRRRLNKP